MKLESLKKDSFKEFESFEAKNLRQIMGGAFHYYTRSYHISDGQRDGNDEAKWTDSDYNPHNGGYSLDGIVPALASEPEYPPTPLIGDEEVEDPVTGEFSFV